MLKYSLLPLCPVNVFFVSKMFDDLVAENRENLSYYLLFPKNKELEIEKDVPKLELYEIFFLYI